MRVAETRLDASIPQRSFVVASNSLEDRHVTNGHRGRDGRNVGVVFSQMPLVWRRAAVGDLQPSAASTVAVSAAQRLPPPLFAVGRDSQQDFGVGVEIDHSSKRVRHFVSACVGICRGIEHEHPVAVIPNP